MRSACGFSFVDSLGLGLHPCSGGPTRRLWARPTGERCPRRLLPKEWSHLKHWGPAVGLTPSKGALPIQAWGLEHQ
jgi:hypothetical protein